MTTRPTDNQTLILDRTENGMPAIGIDGYAGEQDGTRVVYDGVFLIPNRKSVSDVYIGSGVKVVWCRYTKGYGWEISLAHWSDNQHIDISQMYQFQQIA